MNLNLNLKSILQDQFAAPIYALLHVYNQYHAPDCLYAYCCINTKSTVVVSNREHSLLLVVYVKRFCFYLFEILHFWC